jgi:hypothetical protein
VADARWQIAGPGFVMVKDLPAAPQKQFKALMAEVRKNPFNCPVAHPMKGAPGFYAPFGAYTAAFEVRDNPPTIWVSHVTGIDLTRSVVRPQQPPRPPVPRPML